MSKQRFNGADRLRYPPSELYDAAACQPLFQKLATKGIWQTPTLTFSLAIPDLFSGKPLSHAEYASDSLLEFTRKSAEMFKLTEEQLESFRAVGKASLPAIRDLKPSGTHFLAGCDGLVPGSQSMTNSNGS